MNRQSFDSYHKPSGTMMIYCQSDPVRESRVRSNYDNNNENHMLAAFSNSTTVTSNNKKHKEQKADKKNNPNPTKRKNTKKEKKESRVDLGGNKVSAAKRDKKVPNEKREEEVYNHDKKVHPLVRFFDIVNVDSMDAYQSKYLHHSDGTSNDNNKNTTILRQACEQEAEMCELIEQYPKLCTKEYPVNKKVFCIKSSSAVSIYPLHLLCALGISLPCIKLCYEKYPNALTINDQFLGTPFHYACRFYGCTSKEVLLFILLKAQATPTTTTSTTLSTKLLLSTLNRKDLRSPLHLACMNSEIPIHALKFLIKKTPSKICRLHDKYEMNLLHLACCTKQKPRLDVLECLFRTIYPLQHDEDPHCIEVSTDDGSTPLHKALLNKKEINYDVIKLLLNRNPKALRIKNKKGNLPAHMILQYFGSSNYEGVNNNSNKNNSNNKNNNNNISNNNDTMKILRMVIAKYPQGLSIPNGEGEIPQQIAIRMKLSPTIVQIVKPIRGLRRLDSNDRIKMW